MTDEQIMEMAREANLPSCLATHPKALKRFSELVAQHEREACAKLCAEDNVQAMDFTGGTFVGGYFCKKIIDRGQA